MRPRVPVVGVAMLSLLPITGQASVHYEYLDGAHWAVRPGGAPAAVLIVDATGDPRMQEALRAFKSDWNAMRSDPSMSVLPPVDLSFAAAAEACSGTRLRNASGAPAHVVV